MVSISVFEGFDHIGESFGVKRCGYICCFGIISVGGTLVC